MQSQSIRNFSASVTAFLRRVCKVSGSVRSLGSTQEARLFKKTRVNFSSQAQPESKTHLLLLVIPSATFFLGTWQVYRLQWKKELIESLRQRQDAEPIDLPNEFSALKDLEYRRVKVCGTFDHSKELFLGPRALNEKRSSTETRSKSGYQIITPFQLEESGERILINRGWISKDKLDAETRKEGQVEGLIEFVAVVRKNEKRPPFMIKNEIEKNRWHYLDVNTMARLTGCNPVLLDADATSSIPGGPVGGQTNVSVRNEHLQYILTWYSLTAATLYMYYRLRKTPSAVVSQRTSAKR